MEQIKIESLTDNELEMVITSAQAELKHRTDIKKIAADMVEGTPEMYALMLRLCHAINVIFQNGGNVWYNIDTHELGVTMPSVLPTYLKPVNGNESVKVTNCVRYIQAVKGIGSICNETEYRAWVD